jgi:urease accessory protein
MSNLITVDRIIGNVNSDTKLKTIFDRLAASQRNESILINRMESQRSRMRKISNKGTDIALTLSPGGQLRHGDVALLEDDRIVIVEIEPENVLQVDIDTKSIDDEHDHHHLIELLVKIGHTIGNLHRPIKVQGNRVYFPIQAESEIEMFNKLFHPFHHYLQIRGTKIVFQPDEDMEDIHQH